MMQTKGKMGYNNTQNSFNRKGSDGSNGSGNNKEVKMSLLDRADHLLSNVVESNKSLKASIRSQELRQRWQASKNKILIAVNTHAYIPHASSNK